MDIDQIRRTAIAAAYAGGSLLHSRFGKLSSINKKGAIDLVTEADIGAEKAVIETIRSRYPDHTILAEESGLQQGNTEARWIIDPLDGTTNYAHNVPNFSVSVAFARGDDVLVGVVLNPVSGELFTAVEGKGAERNGRPIHVSGTAAVSESLLVTGFPYNFKEIFDVLMARFSACLRAAQGVRRFGSAALDLCSLACGRFDGFWEQNLKPWDTAAGIRIAAEAGAQVTDFSGSPFSIDQPEILATNGRIHQEMLLLLALKKESV